MIVLCGEKDFNDLVYRNMFKMIKKTILPLVILCMLSACSTSSSQNNNSSDKSAFELVSIADKAYAEGRWLEAEQSYQLVIDKVPEDFYAWFRVANTQLRQGNVTSSIRFYEEAIKRSPEQAKPHYNLSTAYLFMALESLRNSSEKLRSNDPGKRIIEARIVEIQKMIGQPVDSFESPSNSLPKNTIR